MISRMIRRVFVEDKNSHSSTALLNDLKGNLNIAIPSVRILQRYDVEGIDDSQYEAVKNLIFCEAPVENIYEESFPTNEGDTVFAVEYLPGQFDQRADSAEQCVQIVARARPVVACARGLRFRQGRFRRKYRQNKKISNQRRGQPRSFARQARNPREGG